MSPQDDAVPSQSETEPEPIEAPDLDGMNVGATDPQAPSHASAGAPADPAASGLPDLGTTPLSTAGGDDEEVETDVATSAARTNVVGTAGTPSGPGDAASVPVVSDGAAPGTSQESAEAQGSRTPQ